MGTAHYTSGGIAIMRARRAAYIANPNLCKQCGIGILPQEGGKLAAAKKKRFCSKSCAGRYNNLRRYRGPLGYKRKRKPIPCDSCGVDIGKKRKYCAACWEQLKVRVASKTKGEVTHPEIRAHSRSAANIAKNVCQACGYDKHIEICHRIPVSAFPDTALISEINAATNLLCLCPNCHWEFDAGLLKLENTAR
jgi:hypothetical protein